MVRLTPAAWQRIVSHAAASAPLEACGILIGHRHGGSRLVVHAEPCENVYPGDRRRHFLIDPERHLALQREARERGLAILGSYHSHPDGTALPSTEDREQAHPWTVMVIVAVREGRVVDVRAWTLEAGQCRQELLVCPG